MKYLLRFLAFFKKTFWMSAIGVVAWLFTSFSQSFMKFWPTLSRWMEFRLRNYDGTSEDVVTWLVSYVYVVTDKIGVLISQLDYWFPMAIVFNVFMGLVGFCLWMFIVKVVVSIVLRR